MDAAIERVLNDIRQRRNTDITPPTYDCEKCNDTEVIFYIKDGIEYGKPCECAERKAAARRMENSGISAEDRKKGFSGFETFGEPALKNAKDKSIEYFKKFDREKVRESRNNSLLLCGASGRGKTTLGLAVANNIMHKKGTGVLYMPYREEITALKQLLVDEYSYNERMSRLKNATVLFIDDLLKGKVTESDLNLVYEIVNHRYLARLPMIISTEKTPQELIDFDEATGSRIIEMCKGNIVVFGKEIQNYRLR